MFKKLLFTLLTVGVLFSFSGAFGTANAYYVNGYVNSYGTYVDGYYRSRPNAYTYDNYSYTEPTYSNGYGYNDSYYSSSYSYSSNWYTPSYYDYSYGY